MFVDQFNNVFRVIDGENPGVTVLVIDFLRVVFAQNTSNQFRVGFDFVRCDDRFQRDRCDGRGVLHRIIRREIDRVCRIAHVVLLRGRLRCTCITIACHDDIQFDVESITH